MDHIWDDMDVDYPSEILDEIDQIESEYARRNVSV